MDEVDSAYLRVSPRPWLRNSAGLDDSKRSHAADGEDVVPRPSLARFPFARLFLRGDMAISTRRFGGAGRVSLPPRLRSGWPILALNAGSQGFVWEWSLVAGQGSIEEARHAPAATASCFSLVM
jgi:hypothetical protein